MLECVTVLMRSVHRVGERPRDLLPSTFPCTTSRSMESSLRVMCPKNLRIRICTVDDNLSWMLSSLRIETLVRCAVHGILSRYKTVRPKNLVSSKNFNNPLNSLGKYPVLFGALFWKSKKAEVPCAQDSASIESLEHADELFEIGHYEECYQYLKKCQDMQESSDVEIQWRICRAMYNMSKESKYDQAYRKVLIADAYKIISEILPNNYENYAVQKWYALLLDARSTQIGIKERINQLENVKKHMDLAVTYNPNDATTLYMLGEWCYQVSQMPWHQRKIAEALFGTPPHSTYEDALEYFLRAESTQPRFYSLNLLRLGNCYLKLNKEDQAKYYLKLAASYPAKSNDDHQANKEATDLLKRIK